MRLQLTARPWLIGAGAAMLLVAGGLAAGPLAGLAQDGSEADLSEDDAVQIAAAEFPDAEVVYVERDHDDGAPVYELTLSNGYELEIDGNSGAILETERDDDDDDDRDDDWNESGRLDDGDALLPDAAISVDAAVSAAQGAAEGRVGEVELERYRGELVFVVEIGRHDVVVDALTGEVLSTEIDD